MLRLIHRNGFSPRNRAGFSLIEVLVAVVILATGLLALAALQGALARNSSDTKARAAIVAALTSRMAQIRQAPPSTGTTWSMSTSWVSNAALQAGTSDLKVVETIAAYAWNGTNFVTSAVPDPTSKFARATLAATWTAANGSKTLTLASDLSSNIYGLGKGYPINEVFGSAAKYPIVRQGNPSNTAGVIPIVTGNQATAASNPQPIIEGANNNLRVGTSFDVLNYIPEGTVARISKRFQTQVVKCRCSFGAAGFSVAGNAQWPATWDGTTYSVYPGSGAAAGVAANAGEDTDYAGSGNGQNGTRRQSEQCTECCRDHHDTGVTLAEAKYDPEASGAGKFNEAGGVLTAANSGDYVAACRVVKVDGLWRTTADMYQRQYGLLETTAVGGVQAKSGIPSSGATSAYQSYVKDYLSQYIASSTTAPLGAQLLFDETPRGLNLPSLITILTASTSDYRYLHGRGLYVDYLGTKAQAAIGKCSGKTGSAYTECVLPSLPFTTINLTEMAQWTASDATVLNINTTKSLNFNVTEPSGGRTAGIKVGSASNNSLMRTSNSGVAVSDDILGAVDTNGDGATNTDTQQFVVGTGAGPGGGTGDTFHVGVSGGGSNPFVNFTVSPTDSGNCTYDGSKFVCPSNSTLPAAGTVVLQNYNQESTAPYALNPETQCTYVGNGNDRSGTLSVQRPVFTNFAVSSVMNGGAASWSVTANSGKTTEVTTVTVAVIPKAPAVLQITFAAESTQQVATVASCSYSKETGNLVLKSISWTRAWQ